MKNYILSSQICLVLFCICHTSWAQRNASSAKQPRAFLQGEVINAQTGEILTGASIYFSDIRRGAVSNGQGQFMIRDLPQGKYLVEVSFLGYASIIDIIDLKGNMQKKFSLKPSVLENEAVTVTGVFAATLVRKAPVPVHIIRKQDILKKASTNLIDALSLTPGISQISTGPAISKPTIRGLGYNRLIVVNDGLRQEGQQWGDEHGIEIDEYSVRRVEVLKGPASIMYGSDALAGVINILTNIPVEEGTIKGNIFGNYQTNSGLTGLNANLAGNMKGFSWNGYGSIKSAYDYQNKYDGRVFNSKFKEKNFGAYAGFNKSWGYSHLLISNFSQAVGLIEGERDEVTGKFTRLLNEGGAEKIVVATAGDNTSRTPFIPKQQIDHFRISTDNSFHTGSGRTTVNIGYQHNQRKEYGNVINEQEKELHFDLRTINYNIQYHFVESRNWQTTVGTNGMYQYNANKGIEALIPAYSLFDAGAFLYTKKSMEKITASGGLRVDNRSLRSKELAENTQLKFSEFTKQFHNVSATAGLSYEAGRQLSFKLNVARGFRAPSIPELASNGAHEGTNRYEYGRNDLKSETSLQFDGGFELNSEHVSLSTSLFHNTINNFIFYRKLSSINGGDSILNINGDDKNAFIFDQETAKLYGAEFNMDIHPHALHWLHIENTFSYVRGKLSRNQEGSRNLPFIPAPRLLSQLRGDFSKKGKNIRNAYISFELDNTFLQNHPFTGYATETSTPGYSLFNASFGGDVMNKEQTLFSIYFSANNITGKAYQPHLSRLKYAPENVVSGRRGVYNTGRNVSVKINIPLSFPVKK